MNFGHFIRKKFRGWHTGQEEKGGYKPPPFFLHQVPKNAPSRLLPFDAPPTPQCRGVDANAEGTKGSLFSYHPQEARGASWEGKKGEALGKCNIVVSSLRGCGCITKKKCCSLFGFLCFVAKSANDTTPPLLSSPAQNKSFESHCTASSMSYSIKLYLTRETAKHITYSPQRSSAHDF
jgi:hypothetical protein